MSRLQEIDPYVSASPTTVFERMADTVEEKTLHMVNSDPRRTPSFTGFADPDWFITGGTAANRERQSVLRLEPVHRLRLRVEPR